ncbi:MAG: hypothetical protein RLZZ231_241 [Bacteroidota bacterium]|jgi:cytochrome c
MRRILVTAIAAGMLLSCGDKKQEQNATTDQSAPATTETTSTATDEVAAEFKKGADLIAANDCLACHQLDEKLVGPSYKEVAAKYSTMDEATLAATIIKGGSGNWGEVPMTPHPTLSTEDATEMVRYILSLK